MGKYYHRYGHGSLVMVVRSENQNTVQTAVLALDSPIELHPGTITDGDFGYNSAITKQNPYYLETEQQILA